MLHSFPTPYPGELWYSVLCRHMIRSGNLGDMWFKKGEIPFSLLYDKSMARVVQELPPGMLEVQEIVMNHTLFPYLTRTQSMQRKQQYLNEQISGTASIIKWKAPVRGASSLRYCPLCEKEDQKKYGESYWHREHQLPLVTMCLRHWCKLNVYPNRRRQHYMPDGIESEERPVFEQNPSKIKLAVVSHEYLLSSWEVCPTAGYNNLFHALEQGEYVSMRRFRFMTIDPDLLYHHLENRFGTTLVRQYFGVCITKEDLLRIKNWEVTVPEKYIMLAALMNQPPDVTFGPELDGHMVENDFYKTNENHTKYNRRKTA